MTALRKRALIVGVNSILGIAIAEKLKDTFDLEGLYNSNMHRIPDYIKTTSKNKLSKMEDNFDLVFFLSAYIPGKQAVNQRLLYETNVELLLCAINQFPSARFILASSVSVYGALQSVITESSPSMQVSAYGLSKLWAEQLLLKHPSYAIIRISSMYGKGMKNDTFLPLVIQDAILDQRIQLRGDGSRKQNYIHVEDVASCFAAAAAVKENGVFLAVAENSYSNLEVAHMIQKTIPDSSIEFAGEDLTISSEYDAEATRSRLDWFCEQNFENGIKELIQWIKKQY